MSGDTKAAQSLADKIILGVCELTDLPDPNDPNALACTIDQLRAVIEQETEGMVCTTQAAPSAKHTATTPEHTPGPWKSKVDGFGISVFAESRPHIAVAIVGKGGRISEERDANARLICAAPDLLAERDRLREELERQKAKTEFEAERGGDIENDLDTAQATIAELVAMLREVRAFGVGIAVWHLKGPNTMPHKLLRKVEAAIAKATAKTEGGT